MNDIIMYTTDDGQVKIEVRLEDENIWLTQNAISELFDTTRNNITMHIKNIFEDGELNENTVSKESLLTANDGKSYKTKFYDLAMPRVQSLLAHIIGWFTNEVHIG